LNSEVGMRIAENEVTGLKLGLKGAGHGAEDRRQKAAD
jgi:hypothetical protein